MDTGTRIPQSEFTSLAKKFDERKIQSICIFYVLFPINACWAQQRENLLVSHLFQSDQYSLKLKMRGFWIEMKNMQNDLVKKL